MTPRILRREAESIRNERRPLTSTATIAFAAIALVLDNLADAIEDAAAKRKRRKRP